MDTSNNLDNSEAPATKTNSNHSKLKTIGLLTIGAIVLLSLVGFGTYHYQNNKLKKAQAELSKSNQSNKILKQNNETLRTEAIALNKKVSSLTTQLKSQTKSNNVTTAPVTPVVVDDLNIKTLGAYRYYTTEQPNYAYIVVDVTLTNTGTSKLTVPLSSFSTADSAGNGGKNFGTFVGKTMPNGKTVLGDKILSPGESVTGAFVFGSLSSGYTLYTLSYKDQTFSLDASTQVKEQ